MNKPTKSKLLRVSDLLASDILREDEKPQIRQWIANATPKIMARGRWLAGLGLDEALIRVGRRVLIDEEIFLRWIEKDRDLRDFEREYHAGMPAALKLYKKRRRRRR
jgi:hypothetical protein